MNRQVKQGVAALSLAGLALLMTFEGKENKAYLDVVNVPTICYGSTRGVQLGQYKTDKECVTLLDAEASEYVSHVLELITVPLTQGQLDALVSFTYNLGRGSLYRSTLRRKLNAGDYCGAASEFPKWNKAGGRVLKGLVKRRAQEQALFNQGLTC